MKTMIGMIFLISIAALAMPPEQDLPTNPAFGQIGAIKDQININSLKDMSISFDQNLYVPALSGPSSSVPGVPSFHRNVLIGNKKLALETSDSGNDYDLNFHVVFT